MAAPDAVTFAIEHGLWHGEPDDPNFSFSDTYDPGWFHDPLLAIEHGLWQ